MSKRRLLLMLSALSCLTGVVNAAETSQTAPGTSTGVKKRSNSVPTPKNKNASADAKVENKETATKGIGDFFKNNKNILFSGVSGFVAGNVTGGIGGYWYGGKGPKDQLSKANSEIKALNDQITSLNSTIDSQKSDLAKYKADDSIQKLETELEQEKAKSTAKEQEITELKNTVTQKDADIRIKDEALKDKDKKINDLNVQLTSSGDKLKTDLAKLNQEVLQLKNDILNKNQKINEFAADKKNLENENNTAKTKNDELTSKLHDANNKIKELENKLKEAEKNAGGIDYKKLFELCGYDIAGRTDEQALETIKNYLACGKCLSDIARNSSDMYCCSWGVSDYLSNLLKYYNKDKCIIYMDEENKKDAVKETLQELTRNEFRQRDLIELVNFVNALKNLLSKRGLMNGNSMLDIKASGLKEKEM